MTDDERTRLMQTATHQLNDLLSHLSTARDIMAMMSRILPVALEMLDSTRGDLDALGGLLNRLAHERPTTETNTAKEASTWLIPS